jgi:hypothetical protein
MPIIEERLERVTVLKAGSHSPPNGDFAACVMEAVSYIAGEPWSDHPACVSPVITAFMISWNDGLPNDEERTRLLAPLIPKLIGTRGSDALENRRATMATDWLVRAHTPAWLRLAGLTDEAEALAGLPEITDFAQTPSIMGPLKASRAAAEKKWDAAWAAARAAAGAAAWDAAWDAARDAAWAAARDAAGAAAWDAARDAARAAARDAAWAAAWAAARDAAWAAAWDAARAAAWDARLRLGLR